MRYSSKMLSFLALGALAASAVNAQEASKEVKVTVKNVTLEAQNTPQVSAPNVKDKRWKPKTWLEVDVAFDAKKAPVPGDKSPFIDSLDFKFFVALNKTDAAGKHILLTASVTYQNISDKDTEHVMVFASPASLAKLLEKTTFTTTDIRAVGVEVYKGGALAGGHSTGAGKWWEKTDSFTTVEGVLVPKVKTPFAPLWGDYDLESKQ